MKLNGISMPLNASLKCCYNKKGVRVKTNKPTKLQNFPGPSNTAPPFLNYCSYVVEWSALSWEEIRTEYQQ